MDQLQVWEIFDIPEVSDPPITIKSVEIKPVVLRPRTRDAKNFLANLEPILEMLTRGVKHKVIGKRFNINPGKVSTQI